MQYSNNDQNQIDFFGLQTEQPAYHGSRLAHENFQILNNINKENLPEFIDPDHYVEAIDNSGKASRWLSFRGIQAAVDGKVNKNNLQYLVKREYFTEEKGTAVRVLNKYKQFMWLLNIDAYVQFEQNRDLIEDSVTAKKKKEITEHNNSVFESIGLSVQ